MWQYLVELGHHSPEGYVRSDSASNTQYRFSDSQNSQVQESEVEMGVTPLDIIPRDALATFQFVSMTYCSADLDV